MSETKPGYKTTEFWLTVGTALGGAGAAFGLAQEHWLVKLAGQLGTVAVTIAYIVARGMVKKA